MPNRKKRRSGREIKQELRAIYSGRDGKLPDLTRLARTNRSAMTSFLIKTIGVLFVLSILAWGGFFLFTRGLFTGSETLRVSIETQQNIRAGEETDFKIIYENKGDVPIAELEVKLNLPNSFYLTSTLPEPQQELEWTIGTLTPRSDGSIAVKGIFLSEVPSVQRIQALVSYKPANFSSNFQEIESKSVEIKESVVEMTITGPEKALAGDPVDYILKIKHNGTKPAFNLRVIPTLPQDFVLEKTDPAINQEDRYWDIGTLDPDKLSEIKLTGTFTSTASGELPVGARLGFMNENVFFKQAETEVKTDVLGGAVSFHLILDGSDKDQTVDSDKTIRGSIDYKNPGTQPVEGIAFTMDVTANGPVPIDWDKAELSEGARSSSTVVWDATNTDAFKKLDAGKEGVIDFTLPLLRSGENSTDAFTVSLSLNVKKVGSITSSRSIDATPINISIASNVSVLAEARWFADDGTPIGTGELPPKVNATTSYRILWNLTNSTHDLGSVEVSTTLPKDVVWKETSGKDIGTLAYNPVTRQVRWEISKLPRDIQKAQAWFDVAAIPKAADAGKFMKLVNQTTLEATDLVTNTQTNSTLDVLTTELPTDEFAVGKGAVRQ